MNNFETTMTTIKATVLISGLATIFLVVPASLQASGAELVSDFLSQEEPAVIQTIEETPVVQNGSGRF